MNKINARERILQAALKVFAEKSFEGSRIEEISREAKVPKSLIYYHFKSKDEIFEVLTSDFISEYMGIIAAGAKETHQEKADGLIKRMENVYFEFGQRNADLMRIIFIDSLKKSTDRPVLYKVLDALIDKEMQNRPDAADDIHERRIAEFFTSFIPNIAYLCFSESWVNYFDMDKSQFDRLYLKVYAETHGAYHKNHQ
jgi:Transcriptional regulator